MRIIDATDRRYSDGEKLAYHDSHIIQVVKGIHEKEADEFEAIEQPAYIAHKIQTIVY